MAEFHALARSQTFESCLVVPQQDAEPAQRELTHQQKAESADMAEALERWRSSKEGSKWQQDRARLPVLAIKQDLLTQLQQHDVVVVSGDTGCGKTTQVSALYSSSVRRHLTACMACNSIAPFNLFKSFAESAAGTWCLSYSVVTQHLIEMWHSRQSMQSSCCRFIALL